MKKAEQWMEQFDPAWADDRGVAEMAVGRIRAIQADALRSALVAVEEDSGTPASAIMEMIRQLERAK